MHTAAVACLADISVRAIHQADNAAHIAYIKGFILIAANTLGNKAIAISCAGSHNIAAIIGSDSDFSIFQITGNAAYVMRAVNRVFLINSVGNNDANIADIAVNPARNAAYVACRIIFLISNFTALHIAAVVSNSIQFRSAINLTSNAAYICNLNIFTCNLNTANSSMVIIAFRIISIRRNIGTISGIGNSGSVHAAHNAADVIAAGNG